jgi:predicted  nucleic acid-binding Zn-ribbon protein
MSNNRSARTVVSFSPTDKGSSSDQLDSAGKSILSLLEKAAGVAEENTQHALVMAENLGHQVRAAEDRIAELEEELLAHRDRADRAEQWLHKVYAEIEERFQRKRTVRHIAG